MVDEPEFYTMLWVPITLGVRPIDMKQYMNRRNS